MVKMMPVCNIDKMGLLIRYGVVEGERNHRMLSLTVSPGITPSDQGMLSLATRLRRVVLRTK